MINIQSTDVAARRALAGEVRRACTDVGFFYGPAPSQGLAPALEADKMILVFLVKNHGIPDETIEAVISASKRFFSSPEEEKLKVGRVVVVLMILIPCAVRR